MPGIPTYLQKKEDRMNIKKCFLAKLQGHTEGDAQSITRLEGMNMEAIETCLRNQDHSERICVILIRTETGSWLIFADVPSKNTEENHALRHRRQTFHRKIETNLGNKSSHPKSSSIRGGGLCFSLGLHETR